MDAVILLETEIGLLLIDQTHIYENESGSRDAI